jgi:uncharacterized protein YccT (UPF0319 family)
MLGYNRMTGYNTSRYNAEGTEIAVADAMTITDDTITKNISKSLIDIITNSDTTAKQQNKSVTETLKLDVWLSTNRKDAEQWED